MKTDLLLTFNAGSSSIKIGIFGWTQSGPNSVGRASIDLRLDPLALRVKLSDADAAQTVPLQARISDDLHEVIDKTLTWLFGNLQVGNLAAVGHRVVHGGDRFSGPERLSEPVLREIVALTPLAPMHQPHSIRLIRAVQTLRPDVAQVASFDTAFHRSQTDLIRRFALPRPLHDQGIKRYGFHGLSYQFITRQLSTDWPEFAGGRLVVAHLGSGASLCAIDGGLSRECSMGFSTLDGIPMATRCGALDAGVVLHLLRDPQRSVDEVEQMLYHESGLLGVSGISADSRVLLASDSPQARDAMDLFAHRVAQNIAAQAVTLGGLDAIVFTAGIGENQPVVREAICRRLELFGVAIDAKANTTNARRIDSAQSRVAILVLATDEEQVIARECMAVLTLAGPP